MKPSQTGVSIIICCYNSADRMPETLSHIAQQQVPAHIPFEVVVVNNASKDATVEVTRKVWNGLGSSVPFRIVEQPIPGLSHAREKGIETAQYEYLLFCDDDNWLHKDYVRVAFEVMEGNAQIGALGGLGVPECEVPPPNWVKDFFGAYAVGPQQGHSGVLTRGGVVFGAGAVYRKEALLWLKNNGFQSLLTGRDGDKLTSGEDLELCYALTLAGYQVWYDDRLLFKHFIRKERINWKYIVNISAGNSQAEPILNAYKLTIDSIYRKRNRIKNTWQWLLMMRVLILFKNIPVSISLLSRKNKKEAWLINYRSIKCIQYLYLYRRKYTESLIRIGNSSWVRR
jgi:glycosyltransferase involved in cell wall biosynthesis